MAMALKSCCQSGDPPPPSAWIRLVRIGLYALLAIALAFVLWQQAYA
ncbi:MAG: hypothetical protein H7330_17410 [Hymenobacteraceae bacterium]|nr:hypothetical protein [Hymenobacteraceae bacterium]